jgi:uncharacterized protein (TIGR02646 family)
MINLDRSYPAPESLAREKAKASGTYNTPEVVHRLKEDFKNKCYLCETKATTVNIEHLKSHRDNKDLKFDWENLFLSCGHCNNIKLDNYDNILDCTKEDVENCIRYKMDPYPKSRVKIQTLTDNERVKKTAELLDKVYNGTTPMKDLESDNIRRILLDELIKFQNMIYQYYYDLDDEDKYIMLSKIKKQLKSDSQFTAFKRWIIKDIEGLREELEQYCV